jgi:type I restriction enzyme M protein
VSHDSNGETIEEAWERFNAEGREFWTGMDALVETLDEVVAGEAGDA